MKKTGIIEAFNVNPEGFDEGFLLRTGKRLAQVNLAKGGREAAGNWLKPGPTITVDG